MLYLERPSWMILFMLFPLFIFLRKAGFFLRPAFPLILGNWGAPVLSWRSPFTRFVRLVGTAAAVIAFFLAVLALSGPVRLTNEAVFSKTGNTVIFILDVSPSMAASDMDGSTRLDIGRQYIRSFAGARSGTAFGLVGLGSSAALLVPPTADHQIFFDRLDALASGEFGDGTALGLGIAVAAAHGASSDGVPVTVILLTDGENNAGEVHPETAASVLASSGAGFYVIGIGSRGPVQVEYVDPVSGTRYSGILESEFDESALASIAAAGNGTYVAAQDRPALDEVFKDIDRSVPVITSSWTRSVEQPLSAVLLRYVLIFGGIAWFFRRIVLGAVI